MRSSNIEPGLLRVFRWYVGVRLGLLMLVAWSNQQNPDPSNPRFPEAGIFFFGILMVLISWPWIQRKMGRAFLPTTLVLASIAPIAESAANTEGRLAAGMSVNEAVADIWMPFFLLFVPLLLTAWQYRYRAVLFFAVATTLLDIGGLVPLVAGENADVAALTGLLVLRGLLYAFVGAFIVKLVGAQKEARRGLATHSTTLEHLATSRERNRLARELHDTLAHSLSGIAVQLEATKALWDDDPAKAQGMLDRALADARCGLGEARRAIQTLRAAPLEELGLVDAVQELADKAAERSGVEVTVAIADKVGDLDPELENTVYRIVDETLTNVARHSQAEQVSIDLHRKAGKVRLEIVDDGAGFDTVALVPDGHIGIVGMEERAEMVGGTLDITSAHNMGTTVTFEVSPWK
ncbi:MAG: sensor histidine kinase [bacterium]|nr:sensor histidine kinase [bacterium]